jgi:hypothetical protein
MQAIDQELERLQAELTRIQTEISAILRVKALMLGQPTAPEVTSRRRASNIKPLVLDIMRIAAESGASTAEVTALVKEKEPNVAKESVGSILSRLKADGAFVYVGERYYDAKFAPKTDKGPFEPLRAVG